MKSPCSPPENTLSSSLVLIRYGLTLDSDGAEGAFLADAWTGSFAKSEGEEIRRPSLFNCSVFFFFSMAFPKSSQRLG